MQENGDAHASSQPTLVCDASFGVNSGDKLGMEGGKQTTEGSAFPTLDGMGGKERFPPRGKHIILGTMGRGLCDGRKEDHVATDMEGGETAIRDRVHSSRSG